MDKVIVTGSTGFIGRQTIDFLKSQNFEIHALTSKINTEKLRKDISWHSVDILNYDQVSDFYSNVNASYLLHLAWYDNPDDRMTSPLNLKWVEASLNLIRGFVENGGKRIVLSGSCAEYDWNYGFCSEINTPTEPHSLYGESKSSLHKLLEKYSQTQEISYACGRIFFVYGPYESENRLVASVIKSLLMNRKVTINHGNYIRDYLHVIDVAEALVKLLASDIKGSVNIASGNPIKLQEIVGLIGEKLNKSELIKYEPSNISKNDKPVIFADINRLKHKLGWIPKYDLEKGIDQTIGWWKHRHQHKSK